MNFLFTLITVCAFLVPGQALSLDKGKKLKSAFDNYYCKREFEYFLVTPETFLFQEKLTEFYYLSKEGQLVSDQALESFASELFTLGKGHLASQGILFQSSPEDLEIIIEGKSPKGHLLNQLANQLNQLGIKLVYAPRKIIKGYEFAYPIHKIIQDSNSEAKDLSTIYFDHQSLYELNLMGKMANVKEWLIIENSPQKYSHTKVSTSVLDAFNFYMKFPLLQKTDSFGGRSVVTLATLSSYFTKSMGGYREIRGDKNELIQINFKHSQVKFLHIDLKENNQRWDLNIAASLFFNVSGKKIDAPFLIAQREKEGAVIMVKPSLINKNDLSVPEFLRNFMEHYLRFIGEHYQQKLKISEKLFEKLREVSLLCESRTLLMGLTDGPVVKTNSAAEIKSEKFSINGGIVAVISKSPEEKLPIELLNGITVKRARGEVVAELGRLGLNGSVVSILQVVQGLGLYLKNEGVSRVIIEADNIRARLFKNFGLKIVESAELDSVYYPSGKPLLMEISIDELLLLNLHD